MKELLKDKKFKYLLAALFFVLIFEIMSLMNIHFNDIAEAVLFGLICIAIGYGTILRGIRNLIKFNFSSINTLMFIAVCGAFLFKAVS